MLWLALDAASREAKRAARDRKAAKATQPSPDQPTLRRRLHLDAARLAEDGEKGLAPRALTNS